MQFQRAAILGTSLALAVFLTATPRALAESNLDKTLESYVHDVWPNMEATAIVQTRDGYLWFGTQDGLYRFDGLQFQLFKLDDTPKPKTVLSMTVDPADGSLWVGYSLYGLVHYANGHAQKYSARDGLPSDAVTTLCFDRSGTLWIGTTSGLATLRAGKLTPDTQQQELSAGWIHSLALDKDGELFAATFTHIFRLDQETGRFQPVLPNIAEPVKLYGDPQGVVWIAALDHNGLYKLDKHSLSHYEIPSKFQTQLTGLYMDGSNRLWVGLHTGICRLATEGGLECSKGNDESSPKGAYCFYEDRERSLWVGAEDGVVHRLKEREFVTYTERSGMPGHYVYALYGEPDGTVWIGTLSGLARLKNGAVRPYSLGSSGEDNRVYAITENGSGSLLTVTANGVKEFRNGKIIKNYSVRERLRANATAIYTDRENNLWIGYADGQLWQLKNDKFTAMPNKNGPSGYVIHIAEDAEGNLWICARDGLYRFSKGVFSRFAISNESTDKGIPSGTYEDANHDLWIGSGDSGLSRLRDGRIVTRGKETGFFEDNIWAILEDEYGYLWMSSNHGLYRVRKDELNDFFDAKIKNVSFARYGVKDGLLTEDFNGGTQSPAWRTANGKLLFASGQGVLEVDPRRFLREHTTPPPMTIESVTLDSKSVAEGARTGVGEGKLEFHYAALSFISPQDNNYKYKLEGFDKDWVSAGNRSTAYYTRVPPGKYAFHVVGSNNKDVWNEEGARFTFTLLPFYYQTLWFRMSCGLATMLLGWAAYRARVAQSRFRERRLEALVEERTQERQRLEAQLLQSQKMEAIGRLAGGVAHDFNNLLTVILGYGTSLAEEMKRDVRAHEHAQQIVSAAKKAASLTQQLLAFSRKQVLQPRSVDLNHLIHEMGKLIAPLIGEDIELIMQTSADLHLVKIDPGQMEQVILNLVINARDAMSKGGRLTLETANAYLDRDYAATHPAVKPGAYVMLAVSDSGVGMSPETQARIFEPFFTTKGIGKGTGLGLATVYGIVKQSGGFIWVYSELEHGTTFKIYLPQMAGETKSEREHPAARSTATMKATILLVEDNAEVRELARSVLTGYGYTVLVLDQPSAALTISLEEARGIDLLLTDVIMPTVNGNEVANHIRERNPKVKVLYMSGYTDNRINGYGVFERGTYFLEKPFTPDILARKVFEVLSSASE